MNTKDDEVAQTATSYTASEITYLRQLVSLLPPIFALVDQN